MGNVSRLDVNFMFRVNPSEKKTNWSCLYSGFRYKEGIDEGQSSNVFFCNRVTCS